MRRRQLRRFFEVAGLSLALRVPGRQDPQNKAMRPFAKRYTALSEFNPQKPAFGCRQLSGCIHGAPPHTPPKGTFYKKSPWESRKTAFDFYCLVFHGLLPRYQRSDVHAAHSPSAASGYQAVVMGLRPKPRPRRLFVKSPLGNPEKQRLTFIVWFFMVCSQGIKGPEYTPSAFDGLYFLRMHPSYVR